MAFLLDTDIAIHLRDGDPDIAAKVETLDDAVMISIITRVELEGGVYRDEVNRQVRRARLDALLAAVSVLAFDEASADAYAAIVAHAGYSRRKSLDRMIAAQALVHHASLVTRNAGDYADIPGLPLVAW